MRIEITISLFFMQDLIIKFSYQINKKYNILRENLEILILIIMLIIS
jgi:hypothetical protein